MLAQYAPFLVRVGAQSGGAYPLTAEFRGAVRTATIAADLAQLTAQEIDQALRWLERGFVDRDYARDLGSRLFAILFPPPVEELFREATAYMAQQNGGVRIILELPATLAPLPWELMYDASHGFLARSDTAPLVRHFTDIPIPHSLPDAAPLRILVIVASPRGFAPVSGGEEVEQLKIALARRRLDVRTLATLTVRRLLRARSPRALVQSVRGNQLVEIDVLEHTTRAALQQKLIEARNSSRGYHVIHFIGHGAGDERGGQLLLEAPAPEEADLVSAEDFAELVDQPSVNLVVLNACQTAASLSLFNGAAQALLRRGIPAVIGMQVQIFDAAAVDFAREFYGAWALGEPVESALAYARRLISQTTGAAAVDWGVPILYMGPVESLRLTVRPPAPPPMLRWARRLAALALFVIFTAIPTFYFYRTLLPPEPVHMNKLFNVAVADFGVVDGADAPARASEDGQTLSDNVFEMLEARFAGIPALAGSVDLQHAYIRFVRGDSVAARRLAAGQLASTLGADVVIFGNLDISKTPPRLTPELYVSPRLTGAEESTGSDVFGAPVVIRLPLANTDNRARLADAFIPRMQALTEFMFGLAFYKADLPDLALQQLTLADDVAQWTDEPGKGKEILYLWIGTTHARRAQLELPAPSPPCPELAPDAIDDLACAQAAYEKAQTLNKLFARAYIGLGNVWASRAKQTRFGAEIIDCQAYRRAMEEYAKAARPEMQTDPAAFVDLKVKFNIGLTYATSYRNHCGEEAYARAVDFLTQAAVAYGQDTDAPVVRELGARIYYQLGLVQALAEDDPAALAALQKVITIAQPEQGAYEDPWQTIRWNGWVQQGEIFARQARQGDAARWKDALNAYAQVTGWAKAGNSLDPIVASQAYYGAGAAYAQMGEPLQALAPLTTSIQIAEAVGWRRQNALNPLPWSAYVALGDAHAALAANDASHWSEALAAYEHVIAAFTRGETVVDAAAAAASYAGAGQVYEAQRKASRAVESYHRALDIPRISPELRRRVEERLQALQSSALIPQPPVIGGVHFMQGG